MEEEPLEEQRNRFESPGSHWLWRWGLASWLFLGVVGAIVVVGLVLGRAHQVVIPLVVAAIIGVLLRPFVARLMRWHLPRWLAVIVVMILIIAVIAGFLTVVIYGITTQAGAISKQVKAGVAKIKDWVEHAKISNSVVNWIQQNVKKAWPSIGSGLVNRLSKTVPGLASFAIGCFIGFFILLFILGDDGRIDNFVASHIGVPRAQGEMILGEVFASFRGYFKGTSIIAAMNAIVVIPVVLILRIPLLGAIVLVTFVTCFIPSFGGYIGGAFAVFVALASQGLVAGVVMLVFSIIAHTILQAPVQAIAYGKTLQLHPLVALLATLLGAVFAGIAGAILAVPLVAVVLKVSAEVKRAQQGDELLLGTGVEPSEAAP